MPDRSVVTLRLEHARLRVLLRAFLKTLGGAQREFRSRDLARMRAQLFRIRLEIVPGALAPDAEAMAGLSAFCTPPGSDVPAVDHLLDLGHALTALEVLGAEFKAPLRVQALLFAEWQLARMDRLEREAQARVDAARAAQAARFGELSGTPLRTPSGKALAEVAPAMGVASRPVSDWRGIERRTVVSDTAERFQDA